MAWLVYRLKDGSVEFIVTTWFYTGTVRGTTSIPMLSVAIISKEVPSGGVF